MLWKRDFCRKLMKIWNVFLEGDFIELEEYFIFSIIRNPFGKNFKHQKRPNSALIDLFLLHRIFCGKSLFLFRNTLFWVSAIFNSIYLFSIKLIIISIIIKAFQSISSLLLSMMIGNEILLKFTFQRFYQWSRDQIF